MRAATLALALVLAAGAGGSEADAAIAWCGGGVTGGGGGVRIAQDGTRVVLRRAGPVGPMEQTPLVGRSAP